ncbi:MAG: alanine racemase [Firmicutes bacterium]|nr:alanine racemase [Bacillota bacterium]
MYITDLETPALIADRNKMQKNLNTMMGLLEGAKPKLRPHYKTHKTPQIALWQLKNGAIGITCSKLSEAEDLASAGVNDILIANQVVQPSKVAKMAQLAKCCKLTVCVDNADNIRQISTAAKFEDSHIHCYVELNIGMDRCGVNTFEEFYELAKLLEELPNVSYDGVQAYAGNLAHEYDQSSRVNGTADNEARVSALVEYLKERGIESREISGASTGTAYLKAKSTIYTEIQAGSFIFMDMSYKRLGLNLFENALHVVCTVISADENHFVIDAGVKSLCPDQDMPAIDGFNAETTKINEEHMIFYGPHNYKVGDMVKVIPGHCCSTVNLYNQIHFTDEDKVVDRLVITSRGKSQ